MKKLYITTAIDYVNNLPHLGTAYEKIGADALARFYRMEGYDVHFQMGNDEHSAGVLKEATTQGMDVKKYCDGMREKFEAIWKSLDISYNDFIQTSEPRHHESVKAFLKKLNPADIEKKPYEGWYCEGCEAFLMEKDLVDKQCVAHKREPKWLQEENFYFLLSKYQQKLLDFYEAHPDFLVPEIRKNEVLSLVRAGLQDISISRSTFNWGIPFPQDPSHVVYVWFDALLNYLTAVGFGQAGKENNFSKWWPADLHVVGKDITRFHCVIWPAMLMSAGLEIPKTVFGHGFVYLKGEKMSKTLGNILTPLDVVPKYGADALRYYLLRESSFGSDGDFTWENFIKRFNSDLANDIGNLLNRTLGMATKYLDGKIAKPEATEVTDEDKNLKSILEGILPKVRAALDYKKGDVAFHTALASIWEGIAAGDKYIDTCAPWKLAKEGKTQDIQRVLYNVLDSIRNIAILVTPFIPGAAQKIWDQLGLQKSTQQTFQNIGWAQTAQFTVTVGQPIFPRIELTKDSTQSTSSERLNSLDSKKKLDDGGFRGRRSPPESETKHPALPGQGGKEKKMETTTQPATIEQIGIEDFMKVDLRIAEIKQAEKVEGADKLLKLQLDVGGEPRQIVAGIALHYKPEELIGKKITIVANLKPAKIRGVESHGMLLAASDANGLSVLTLDRGIVGSGAKAK